MRIICLVSFLFFSVVAFSQKGNDIIVNSSYSIDWKSEWKLNNIHSKKFYPLKYNSLSIGFNQNAAVWCAFKIRNANKQISESWLCFDNNHLDSIELFDNGNHKVLGDRTKNVSPFLKTQAFKIVLEPDEERTVYVRLKKGISFFEFSYHLGDAKKLAQQSRIKIALISFFLGIIFILILFNAILLYFTRNKMYLYYIMYSMLSALYIMISSYYAKFFILTKFLHFSELRIYTASFWLISLTVFLCYYLDLKKIHPVKYNIIFWLNIVNITVMLITIILLATGQLNYIRIFFTLGYSNFFVIIVCILWSALASLKINRNAAIYVLFAFLPQSIWGLGIILKSFGAIPKNMDEDALIVISLYEVFLFGYVLACNYIETFQKNNQLMYEIITEKENSLQAITRTQIRERRNIANIVHDNFGSKIAYILQLLQLKNIMLANENIKELANEIREISHQILPKSLDEGALVSSLNSQINTWNSGLKQSKIELFAFDFPEKIQEVWIYDLYLITTEIINNSLKHGKSEMINIELYSYDEAYHFQFTDDGIGYDTKKIAKGFGLENIEKRVIYYKGSFEINSTENEGTIIQITIPKDPNLTSA